MFEVFYGFLGDAAQVLRRPLNGYAQQRSRRFVQK